MKACMSRCSQKTVLSLWDTSLLMYNSTLLFSCVYICHKEKPVDQEHLRFCCHVLSATVPHSHYFQKGFLDVNPAISYKSGIDTRIAES